MSADAKSTRIPKFSFGFRKTKVEDEAHARSKVVNQDSTGIERSATPTNSISGSRSAESSPKLGRSKSLRIPRPSKYGSKSQSQSPIPESNQNGFNRDVSLVPDVKSVKNVDRPIPSHGRSLMTSQASSSSNHSSRSSSPSVSSGGTATDKQSGGRLSYLRNKSGSGLRGEGVAGGYSMSQTDESPDEEYFDRYQRRTQSFSSRQHTHVRSGSHGNSEKLVPPGSTQFGRNHPSRRSKTPTSTFRSTSSGLQQKRTSQGNSGNEKMAIIRTTSLGKVNRIKRVEEGESQPVQKSVVTRRTSADPRNKRPVSMVGSNNTPDLNSLAQEMTSNDQSDSKIARPHASKLKAPLRSRRSQSALDHHPPMHTRHTPSPTDSQPVTSTTSQATSSNSSNEGPGFKSYEQPTIASSAKTSRPGSSNSHYRTSRQGSFGSQTNLSSISNESFKHELNKKKSLTNIDAVDGASGSGRATPTNGRNTPVSRSGKKGRDSADGNTVSSTTGKFGSGLPPRTPYRVARTMVPPSSGPVGINELEGSVLLEADDYLRVCHDVKALKTSLLRLKRELQTNSTSTPSTGSTAVNRVNRNRSSPATEASGTSLIDLKKKLKLMTTERDKALEEVGSLKKETKSLSSTVTGLTSDLSTLKTTHSKLEEEFKQVEGHRNMLLDKVERLHADKHKLEHRLMSYEKASIYEQTLSESWLDEVDGDDSFLDIEDMEDLDYEGQSLEIKSSDELIT